MFKLHTIFHHSFVQFCTLVRATQIVTGQVCHQAYLPGWQLWEKMNMDLYCVPVYSTYIPRTEFVIFCPIYRFYYKLYSLSFFSLAKSLQLILEISATYRLVSYLLDNWLICRLGTQRMISSNGINSGSLRRCVIFFKATYNKTIIRFGFWYPK